MNGPEEVEEALSKAEALIRSEAFSVVPALSAVLDALCRSGITKRAMFAMVTSGRNSIEGRLGSGEGVQDAMSAFSFPLRPLDVLFAVTLQRRQDLLVRRDTDGRFERTRLVKALKPQTFAFLPVVADNLAIGCLYADSQQPHCAIPDWLWAQLERGRDLIGKSLERTRNPECVP